MDVVRWFYPDNEHRFVLELDLEYHDTVWRFGRNRHSMVENREAVASRKEGQQDPTITPPLQAV